MSDTKQHIRLAPSGKLISCAEGETVLSALEKSGHMLPNNCRAGACGECKVKVLKGTFDQGFVLDMALSQEERSKGFGLMCMAKLTGPELEIEFEVKDNLPKLFSPEDRRPFMLIEKRAMTHNIVRLTLRTLGKPMRFWPGQYIMLGDDKKARPYSIANINNSNGELILFVTKLSGGTISQWIHEQLNEGDLVNISGPYGTFIGRPGADAPVLCLAAGSGLAPIMSLATAALMRGGFTRPATIIFSARTKEDIYERPHFRYLEQRFANFKFIPTLTQEKNPDYWHGRIPAILAQKYSDLSQTHVYISGPVSFVEDCKQQVLKLGLKEENLFVEGFHSQHQ